jgi:hypothetical protein
LGDPYCVSALSGSGTGGLMREELIELENVPDEKLELLLNTPGSAIGTSRDQRRENQLHYCEGYVPFWQGLYRSQQLY